MRCRLPSEPRVRPRFHLLLATALAAALAGCGTTRDASTRPAELTEIRSALSVAVAWRVDVGASRGALLQPAVADNAVFAAAASGALVRVEPESGRVVWRVDTGQTLSAGVGTDGLTVAVVTARGEVLAYDGEGQLRWRATVNAAATTPPLVGRGLVIVRGTDFQVTAFGVEDGRRRWSFQRTNPPLSLRAVTEMAFAGESVLVGFPGGRLVALALANGAARWEATVAEPRGATEVERLADVIGPVAVAADGPEACAAAYQGRVTCVDAASGALLWTREWPAGGGVALGDRALAAIDVRSEVGAFARSNGASLWRSERLLNRNLTSPAVLRPAVVVGDFEGYLHFLAPPDGELLARVRVDGSRITAPPRVWAAGLIVQTQGGTLARVTVER
jgi:outer membrane protein assembly factor BamB